MNTRITPDRIINLRPNQIFVFGSNLAGRHGKGAAKIAMAWGAKYGQAEGLQGTTYAIPTKDRSVKFALAISEIKVFTNNFIEFARSNEDLIFLLTEIGCGLAGYTPAEVAPLFNNAKTVQNIWLPERFWQILKVRTIIKSAVVL